MVQRATSRRIATSRARLTGKAGTLAQIVRFISPMRRLPLIQGTYFLVTGLWPIVHLRSFEKVSGPKVDRWLVKTFGALTAVVGASLLLAARESKQSQAQLGIGSAGAIAAAELNYALRGRISAVYAADAAIELAFVTSWLRQRRLATRHTWRGR
jgi:hypothetical protein